MISEMWKSIVVLHCVIPEFLFCHPHMLLLTVSHGECKTSSKLQYIKTIVVFISFTDSGLDTLVHS